MNEILMAFGRGLIKTLISMFVGAGVGLVTFGSSVKDASEIWERPGPPPAFFLATGTGLLTTGVMMLVMFLFMRGRKAPLAAPGKGRGIDE